MPKIKYVEPNQLDYLKSGKWDWVVENANSIIQEYSSKGYTLTLRQLYYQFVARNIIPNKQSEYDRLGVIINNARLAGLVDWNAIVDRTRNLKKNTHWRNPGQIIDACAYSFMLDRWATQPTRVEVWIEKDALVGVIEGICKRMDVPYFSCRGYNSASEMWGGARRVLGHVSQGQNVVIIHLGDHDPSGMDMTRDIAERLSLFTSAESNVTVKRMALNMDQVEELNLPPNPAKFSDSRAKAYVAEFGKSGWELDALDPEYMEGLIRRTVNQFKDEKAWITMLQKELEMKETLKQLAKEHGE